MTDRNRCVSCAREQRAFFLFFWWLICNSLDPKKNTKRAKWSQNSGLFLLCLRPLLLPSAGTVPSNRLVIFQLG